MTWKPIDGRILTIEAVTAHIATVPFTDWRPSGGVLHNTAAPDLKLGLKYSIEHWRDMWVGYYKSLGWSAGPHFFCFPDKVLLFTPVNVRGVHSPSWNGTKFGVEMVADFDHDDDDAGLGLKIKMNAVAVFAALYARLGLDPAGIKLHKEDTRTTHDCPGRDIDKAEFIQLVQEYMGEGGEHPPVAKVLAGPQPPVADKRSTIAGVPDGDHLNVRELSSASSRVVGTLTNGARVAVIGDAMNGKTKWLRIIVVDSGRQGFVNARYVLQS